MSRISNWPYHTHELEFKPSQWRIDEVVDTRQERSAKDSETVWLLTTPKRAKERMAEKYVKAMEEFVQQVIFIPSSDVPVKDSLQESADFYAALSRLQALREVECDVDDDEGDFSISQYAFNESQRLLIETYRRLNERFPRPAIFANGSNGVLLQWDKNERQVRLVIPKDEDTLAYIYHEEGADYNVDGDVSADTVADWLNWLLRA